MNKYLRLGALALVLLAAGACDNITNPAEEEGQMVGPYVRFTAATANARLGATTNVIFQLPTRIQDQDVRVQFSFGGSAVYGEDFRAVDRTGAARTDVTASGGAITIPYSLTNTSFLADTLRVQVLPTATTGRTIAVEMTGAATASGQSIQTGHVDRLRRLVITILP
jgi:hypothetical protein